ncbi:MAG: penicillin-binding protein 2 [Candidatus Babeliales bacterium]|nr:penicillin-binding protein 2 [Candidatus Babeliales bacterium]
MNNDFKLRSFIVFSLFCLFYFILLINLYVIQVFRANYYAGLANKQHFITTKINPPRALILDRNNKPVALNKESLSAFILPHKLEDPDRLKTFLKSHFPNSLARLKTNKNKYFMYVKRKLTNSELELIEKSELRDIKILKEPSRFYPVESMATVVGVTDIDNNGLFGIELQFNKRLAGTPKVVTLEKDARSGHFYFKKETLKEGTSSQPIKLTIDSELQYLIQEELNETVTKLESKDGNVIVMDPVTGDILAMVNAPSFDPNNTAAIDMEMTKNKVIADAYERGSVMKIFVALAAFEEGLTTPEELIDCENKKIVTIDRMTFSTWKAHGILPFSEVLEKSNNVGMVKIAQRVGKKLYDHYLKMLFATKTDIPLPGEQKGFITHPKNWSKRSIVSLSFGYEITSTLIQLARAFCIIANSGYSVKPKLIYDEKTEKSENPIYSEQSMNWIREIMQNTVNQGTARRAAIKGYNIMAKTGTANIAINGEYSKTKNMYCCAGIIEKGNYKRVIVTSLREANIPNALASNTAVPLFEQIAEKILIHDKLIQ